MTKLDPKLTDEDAQKVLARAMEQAQMIMRSLAWVGGAALVLTIVTLFARL